MTDAKAEVLEIGEPFWKKGWVATAMVRSLCTGEKAVSSAERRSWRRRRKLGVSFAESTVLHMRPWRPGNSQSISMPFGTMVDLES